MSDGSDICVTFGPALAVLITLLGRCFGQAIPAVGADVDRAELDVSAIAIELNVTGAKNADVVRFFDPRLDASPESHRSAHKITSDVECST